MGRVRAQEPSQCPEQCCRHLILSCMFIKRFKPRNKYWKAFAYVFPIKAQMKLVLLHTTFYKCGNQAPKTEVTCLRCPRRSVGIHSWSDFLGGGGS